jgi:hypothetical protein
MDSREFRLLQTCRPNLAGMISSILNIRFYPQYLVLQVDSRLYNALKCLDIDESVSLHRN